MRLYALLAFAGAALVGAVLIGAAPPPKSELQRNADRLIETTEFPGIVTLVEQDDRRTVVAAGLADVQAHRRMRPNDRFWIGSITKAFVATVVMQLVAEDRLGLDDTVEELLPGRVREGQRIRLRHLLNHTSGIPEYMRLDPWATAVSRNPRVVIPARRLVSSAGRLPLDFEPGTRASYSNTNYLVLAEILERETGRPIARVLRARIFGPLGLRATGFVRGQRAVGGNRVRGYDVSGPRPVDVSLHRLGGPWADGALVSSARDLAVFVGVLLRGKLVPPRLVALMTTPTKVPGSHGEGLGLYKLPSPCGRWYYGHAGGTPGYVTWAVGSRYARTIVVLAANGISNAALQALGKYLDGLLCRR
jgi:D-alanyl-D-alanine carboxypeptidase